jgi:hypothetical protein
MAIIIGFGTLVGGIFSGACATNVSWGYNPNLQRLYCLGSMTPWMTIEKPTETINVTVYQEGVAAQSVAASTSCTDITAVNASVSPSFCGVGVEGVSGDWYIVSYSYNKGDPNIPGQETWGLQRWVEGSDPVTSSAPDYVIRNAAEGQSTRNPGGPTGVTFIGDIVSGYQGSVAANSVGQADIVYYGMVTSVGGANLGGGEIANSSVSVPHTPLWV